LPHKGWLGEAEREGTQRDGGDSHNPSEPIHGGFHRRKCIMERQEFPDNHQIIGAMGSRHPYCERSLLLDLYV
jgi:hypothetical protein